VGRRVREYCYLVVLRGDIHDRVRNQVHEPERCAGYLRGRHVADRDGDPVGAWLGRKLRCHVRRQLKAVHGHAAGAQRERHPAGADGELQCFAATSQVGQHGNHRVEDRWPEVG